MKPADQSLIQAEVKLAAQSHQLLFHQAEASQEAAAATPANKRFFSDSKSGIINRIFFNLVKHTKPN